MDQQAVWVLFFTTVVGWQYHPGRKCPLSIPEAAEVADAMMREYVCRIGQQLPPSAET